MKNIITKTLGLVLALLLLVCALPFGAVSASAATTTSGLVYTSSGGKICITDYTGSDSALIIPETIGGAPVTQIGKEAFKGDKLEYIRIPKTIEKIGADAFLDCYTLETVDITDIGAWCEIEFGNEYACPTVHTYSKLCIDGVEIKSLNIPEGTTKIGAFAFYANYGIEAVFIPKSVKSIGEMAFRGARNIKDVYCVSTAKNWEAMTAKAPMFLTESADAWLINPKEKAIDGLEYTVGGNGVVINGYHGNLFRLEIPSEIEGKPVVKIDSYAFEDANTLAEVILPDTIKDIFPGAFYKCKYLADIKLPKGLKTIHEEVFGYCESLRSIGIPKGVTEIVYYAFRDCYSLTKVTVPEGVKTLGENAFDSCINLKEVILPDTITDMGGGVFYNTALYNDESNWLGGVFYVGGYLIKAEETLSGKYTVREGTRIIPDNAFFGNTGLTEVVLPDSVIKIGRAAFYECKNLKKVTLPEGITEIPDNTFDSCSELESINIPSTVTKIGGGAFHWCRSLKEITIPEGVTKIKADSFSGCGFESITLPASVTIIEDNAFRNCTNLAQINIGNNINSISFTAFTGTPFAENQEYTEDAALYLGNCLLSYSDVRAKTYTVKDGTRTIGFDAFRNAYDLEEINIPESVENLGKWAFSGPIELKVINFGGSELQWNALIQDADTALDEDVTVNFAKESQYITGDVTLDGRLNIRDATLIQKYMAKIETLEGKALELADFNNDSKINVKDATAIQKNIAGLK